MKRKILLAVTAISIIVCALAVFVACNPKDGKNPSDNVSRQTDAYFAGESDMFSVAIEKGRREKIFIADGKATDVQDFCQITVVPLKSNDYDGVSYVVKGENDATLSGELDSAEYGEYSATINLDFVPTSITLTAGSDVSEIELKNVLEGALTSADIINLAKDAFKEKIELESADGKPQREIYVKLISGDRKNYYYYVSFIGDGVDYWAMLLDPKTGDIISKK